ncbi:hypothetical protein OJ998_20990 [Solirubrobacter taibaiensis]|nr:hypothetical protein [Solirubrobacter taibaiensis]
MVLFWLVGMVIGALSTAAGQAEQERSFWSKRLIAWLAAVIAAFVAFAISVHEPDVPTGYYVTGLFYAVVFAVLPVLAFYAIGHKARGWIATVACLVLLCPLGAYLIFAMFTIVDVVACGPDAYECPF